MTRAPRQFWIGGATVKGVGFDSLSTYCFNSPAQPGLVVGYGAITTIGIEHGLRRLRQCFVQRR